MSKLERIRKGAAGALTLQSLTGRIVSSLVGAGALRAIGAAAGLAWSVRTELLFLPAAFVLCLLGVTVALGARSRPDIRISLETVGVGEIDGPLTGVFAAVTVRNLGSPSIVTGYTLAHRQRPEEAWRPIAVAMASSATFQFGTGFAHVGHQQFIFQLTSRPLPQGGAVTGFLIGSVDGYSREAMIRPGVSYRVECRDVFGHRAESIHTMSGDPPLNSLPYFAGTTMSFGSMSPEVPPADAQSPPPRAQPNK